MNLVISGPIDDSLRIAIVETCKPDIVAQQRPGVYRLEGSCISPGTRGQIADLCNTASVDYAYVEEDVRFVDIKLLAFDMDSTLITIECIDEIAAYAGKRSEVSAITEKAMRGEISNFEESLRARVALLAGVDAGILERVFDERLALSLGASDLVQAARLAGIHCLLLSGGFTYFTNRLKQQLHLDEAVSNTLEIQDGKLTGRVIGPIIDGSRKALQITKRLAALAATPRQGIVVGDGANDLEMMSKVINSVAFHAKPIVREAAAVAVNFGGLDVILDYYQAR